MKVTITGRGVIPYIRAVAPVSGIEVDIKTIRALLNVPKFSVYDANTGVFINKTNIDSYENPVVEEKPVVEAPKKKEKKVEKKPEPVVEAPAPVEEPVKEEYVEPVVEAVEETPVVEEAPGETVEEAPVEETPAEEETTEAKPANNGYNGKKNKKHH